MKYDRKIKENKKIIMNQWKEIYKLWKLIVNCDKKSKFEYWNNKKNRKLNGKQMENGINNISKG